VQVLVDLGKHLLLLYLFSVINHGVLRLMQAMRKVVRCCELFTGGPKVCFDCPKECKPLQVLTTVHGWILTSSGDPWQQFEPKKSEFAEICHPTHFHPFMGSESDEAENSSGIPVFQAKNTP
jgi:hypothetical protein